MHAQAIFADDCSVGERAATLEQENEELRQQLSRRDEQIAEGDAKLDEFTELINKLPRDNALLKEKLMRFLHSRYGPKGARLPARARKKLQTHCCSIFSAGSLALFTRRLRNGAPDARCE